MLGCVRHVHLGLRWKDKVWSRSKLKRRRFIEDPCQINHCSTWSKASGHKVAHSTTVVKIGHRMIHWGEEVPTVSCITLENGAIRSSVGDLESTTDHSIRCNSVLWYRFEFFMLNKLIGSFIGQKMYNKLSSAPVLSEYSGTQQLAIVGYPARWKGEGSGSPRIIRWRLHL